MSESVAPDTLPARRRRRWFVGLWPLGLMLGLWAVIVINNAVTTPRPLGSKAPEFGSSQRLSRLEDFAVGNWQMEESSDDGKPLKGSLVRGDRLLLRADKTFRYSRMSTVATGNWRVEGQEVNLSTLHVDSLYLTTGGKSGFSTIQDNQLLVDFSRLAVANDHRRLVILARQPFPSGHPIFLDRTTQ